VLGVEAVHAEWALIYSHNTTKLAISKSSTTYHPSNCTSRHARHAWRTKLEEPPEGGSFHSRLGGDRVRT
jgi:hypothetical protein